MRTLNRPIIDRLADVIARGQKQGLFRRDVDPVEVHKAIAALGMFNVTNQYTFGAILQREMGGRGEVAARGARAATPAWAQAKPTLRFAAVFSDKDIRADMVRMLAKEVGNDFAVETF